MNSFTTKHTKETHISYHITGFWLWDYFQIKPNMWKARAIIYGGVRFKENSVFNNIANIYSTAKKTLQAKYILAPQTCECDTNIERGDGVGQLHRTAPQTQATTQHTPISIFHFVGVFIKTCNWFSESHNSRTGLYSVGIDTWRHIVPQQAALCCDGNNEARDQPRRAQTQNPSPAHVSCQCDRNKLGFGKDGTSASRSFGV